MNGEFFNRFAVNANEQVRLLGLKHGTLNCVFDALKSIEENGQEMSETVKEQIIIKIKNCNEAFSSKQSEVLYKTKDSDILLYAFKFLTRDVAVKVLQEGLIPSKKWRDVFNEEEIESIFNYILDTWNPISYDEYKALLSIKSDCICELVLGRLSSFDTIVQLVMDDSLPEKVKEEINYLACTDREVLPWLDLSIKELCLDEMLNLFSHSYSDEVRKLLEKYVKFSKAMDYYIKHLKEKDAAENDLNANYDAFESLINEELSSKHKDSREKKYFTEDVVNSLLKSDKLIEDGAILEFCSKSKIIELAKERHYSNSTAISNKLRELNLSVEECEDIFFNANCFIEAVAEKVELKKVYNFVLDFPKKRNTYSNLKEYDSYYTSLINYFASQLEEENSKDCFTDEELLKLLSINHEGIVKMALKKISDDKFITKYLDKNDCDSDFVYMALQELEKRGFELGAYISHSKIEQWLMPKAKKSK